MSLTLLRLPKRFHTVSDRIVPEASFPAQRPQQVASLLECIRSVRAEIWNDLPLPALAPRAVAKHKHIIDLYAESHRRLQRYRQEANELLHAICTANVISHDESPQIQSALQSEVTKLQEKVQLPELSVMKAVGADLGRHDIGVAFETLETALARTLNDFLYSFERALMTLFQDKSIGSIEWTNDSMCQFSFALLEIYSQGSSSNVRRLSGLGRDQVWTTEREQYVTSHWRIEHHLMRSKMKPRIGLSKNTPPRAMHLWDSVPDWLGDHVGVVHGDLFRKQAVVIAKWEDAVVRQSYHEEVKVYCDPAIVLFGQLVLTAWDQQELDSEQAAITLDFQDPSKRQTSPPTQPARAVHAIPETAFETQDLQTAFPLFVIPAFLSFVCSMWFPGAIALPLVAALVVLMTWILGVRSFVASMAPEAASQFQLYSICCGVFTASAALTAPYAIATMSLGALALSAVTIVGSTVCWIAARDLLDRPRN